MDKKVWQTVEDRSEGLCEFPIDGELCRCNVMCEKHHIFNGTRNRKKMEMAETVIELCDFHHNNNKTGVHHNKYNRQIVREWAINNLIAIGWTKEKILKEVGKWDGE